MMEFFANITDFLEGIALGLWIAAILWHPKLQPADEAARNKEACQNLLKSIRSEEEIKKNHKEADEAVAELRQELGV